MTSATADIDQNPGDLGRRIRERRERLGLSLGDLAHRAGMAPGYLEYLEHRPGANPTAAAITRLAAALDTTIAALRGGGAERPPGAGRPSEARPVLEALAEDECVRLLGAGGVGRVVYDEERGPVAVPVNFLLVDGAIVLRTDEGPIVGAARSARHLSFEVDHLDETFGEGWSVLVVGAATVEPAPGPGEPVPADRPLPDPWAGGDRFEVVRIALDEVSGRRIRHR